MSEKLKNAARVFYVIAVCGLLAVPTLKLTAQEMQKGGNDEAETATAENRVLAEKPTLKTEDGTLNRDFTMQYEAWFSDRFGLRTELVTSYGKLISKLFGVSTEKDVIIGKNDWLFFTSTIPDATGVRTLNDTEIRHIVHNLQMMRDYAAANGSKLVFAAAPNKASIYPEQLPAWYLQTGEKNNLDALYEALSDSGITVCDWRSALLDAKSDSRLLYHRLDTHWNGDGAMLGYQMLMQTLGLDDFGFPMAERTETCDWDGDLWDMLSPAEKNPDQNAVYAVPQTFQYVGRMRSIDDMMIRTSCESGTGTLLMFRDSFGRALIPLLGERFASCTFIRANAVPMDMLAVQPADYVVYELVERNLDHLLTHAPQMPAPATQLPTAETAKDAEPIRLVTEENGQYLHVYGLFDPAYAEAEAVYLSVNGQSYEAFLCCEQEALELEKHQANGFSCYLPAEIKTDSAVQVIVRLNGQYIQSGEAQI